MDANISSAMSMAQPALPTAPRPTADISKASKAAKDYESVFIAQFLGSMFSGIKSDGITGGGQGEEMFRSMMVDQYAKGLTARGGFGLADKMQAELLKHQQVTVQ
ncbi:MAG: Chemotactic signal-response protein cheL [Alphaproteobacteria bacterium]|nr:Chemotactic signal-response protein cheL [Alphaproteobacteria bacterium]MDB5739993.1 Chemotactic signal-response protein cheL [Alphaproteobacteria bacterium]